MAIIRLKERCNWCGKKTLGKDDGGLIVCVTENCTYDNHKDIGMTFDEFNNSERSYDIFEALMCWASRPNHIPMQCGKLKGHKGKHVDPKWKELAWD